MKHHFGGAAAVAAVAVLLLSSCSGQQPRSGSSGSESWGTAPQQPPRTTTPHSSSSPVPSPSKPQPSETFAPEQLEAANTVIEYFRILDQTFSSLDADPQPLKDITTGQTQEMDINDLNDYREQGKIQTGNVIVHILGSEEPKEVDGLQVTAIQICTDAENIDVIDSKTGKTVLKPGQRPPYLRWDINVVKIEDGWRVRETTNDWTAIGFVDGSEKLGLWFRLPSWVSPSPDGLRSGCGTRARNEAWSDCNRVQSMMSPL